MIITQTNLTIYGGAERILLKIAKHYRAKIYTLEYNPNTTFEGFKDIDIELIKPNKFSKILPYGRVSQGLNYGLGFYNFKIPEDYDLINAHMAPSHWIRNKNERVLWYCHTPLRDIYDLYKFRLSMKKWHQKPIYIAGSKGVKLLDGKIVKKIEYIFANSMNTKSRIEKYYGRNDAKVLHGAIDYKDYKNEGDEQFFFYPSRISPNKRQEFTIDAFNSISKKNKNYKLIIAGALSKDSSFKEYYNMLQAKAKTNKNIHILTNISDKEYKHLISKSTAVLFPPINEDYGLVPLDAMAAGKPIIAINQGGPKETIINNKTGFLINSKEEMADKMEYIISHPSIANQIGKAGIVHVRKNFSWELFFNQFDKQVRHIAKNNEK